jgi:hypothetical protein
MKSIIMFLLAGLALAAHAQKGEDFRIVDGKLYNIQKSTNWMDIAYTLRVTPDKKAKESATLTVDSVKNGEVHCTRSVARQITPTAWTNILEESIIVRNLPVPPIPGMAVTTCRAMKITAKTYDCGTPNRKKDSPAGARPGRRW